MCKKIYLFFTLVKRTFFKVFLNSVFFYGAFLPRFLVVVVQKCFFWLVVGGWLVLLNFRG